jgi:DNA-binding MarR family transcriptional regulator
MSITFIDLELQEAVRQARALVDQGKEGAWEALDLHLRWHLVNQLQNRAEDREELSGALLEAYHWAETAEREPWRRLWAYLMELLADAESQPSRAGDLEAVEGRAAEMLRLLVRHPKPLRPGDLADRMRVTPQQVSNLVSKLEAAGLIVRQRSGRSAWLFPSARGARLVELLPESTTGAEADAKGEAPEISFWNGAALAEVVKIPA